MKVKSKADAQLRADQIGYFQAELEIIEQENIISLQESQRSAVTNYHENLIAQMSSAFDIDSSKHEKQFSLMLFFTKDQFPKKSLLCLKIMVSHTEKL